MSLAFVTVTSAEFDFVHRHLMSRAPRYQNMHLREAYKTKGRPPVLRHLHSMHADTNEIQGMISGPRAFAHYRIFRLPSGTQLDCLVERGDKEELAWIAKGFISRIMKRVRQDQGTLDFPPNFTKGQLYLRRDVNGSPPNALVCVRAVESGELHREFVSNLSPWRLLLRRH